MPLKKPKCWKEKLKSDRFQSFRQPLTKPRKTSSAEQVRNRQSRISDNNLFISTETQAFSDSTDDKGEVDIIPLRQGFWKASVEHKADFPDQTVCQKQANYSTLTFQIGHSHH